MFTTILIFFVILLVLVLAHEWGHFFAARWLGIKVEEFGFGFPPRLASIERGGTKYSFNWLPLGGFVKLKGEAGTNRTDPDSFASKKPWRSLCPTGIELQAENKAAAEITTATRYIVGIV